MSLGQSSHALLNVHYSTSLMQSSSSVKADVQEEPQGLAVSQIGVEVICHRDAHTWHKPLTLAPVCLL